MTTKKIVYWNGERITLTVKEHARLNKLSREQTAAKAKFNQLMLSRQSIVERALKRSRKT